MFCDLYEKGICCLNKIASNPVVTKTIIARIKRNPPSPALSMPITRKCDMIAPSINPMDNRAPQIVFEGIKSNIAAINSKIPEAIRPQGSTPIFSKRATLSGCAVNLKNSVCSKIIAGIIRRIHNRILLFFILIYLVNFVQLISALF